MKGLIFAGLMAFAAPATAESPNISLRPVARADAPAPRPVARPTVAEVQAAVLAMGLQQSLRPVQRSSRIEQKAMAKRQARRRGAVCGDLEIQGEEVGTVPGRLSACGIRNAVKIKSVSGVTLSQQSLMDCTTAKALKRWVDQSVKPAFGRRGGGIARLQVAAHYSCRTRNNRPGAKISEHGKGRAIDISGFTLKDGRTVTVLNDWGRGRDGRALRQMHQGACGPFGTVLGPESDRFHKDHFHFDTARYRGGPYCR